MRENIGLFKAKDIITREWVEGDLLCDRILGIYHIRYLPRDNWENFLLAEVDPETICQYTGLKDKHGNKIWENDIVKIQINDNTDNEEFICEVRYYHLAFDFIRINGNEDKGCVVFARCVMSPTNYEVIGNRFEEEKV